MSNDDSQLLSPTFRRHHRLPKQPKDSEKKIHTGRNLGITLAVAAAASGAFAWWHTQSGQKYPESTFADFASQLSRPPYDERWSVPSPEVLYSLPDRAIARVSADKCAVLEGQDLSERLKTGRAFRVSEFGPDSFMLDDVVEDGKTLELKPAERVTINPKYQEGFGGAGYQPVPADLAFDNKPDISKLTNNLVSATGTLSTDGRFLGFILDLGNSKVFITQPTPDQLFLLNAAYKNTVPVTVHGRSGDLHNYTGDKGRKATHVVFDLRPDCVSLPAYGLNAQR